MAVISGLRGQPSVIRSYDFSGAITAGGTAQPLLPVQPGRVGLFIQNTSAGNITLGIGPATATATVSGGAVTAVAVANAGMNYTYPPTVIFYGGGVNQQLVDALGAGLDYPSPSNRASAHAVITGGVISSIVIDNAGSGYISAPYVYLKHDPRDPYGGYAPSATLGIVLPALGTYSTLAEVSHTMQVNIWGATTAQAFVCQVVI